jgi:hypothetical protein
MLADAALIGNGDVTGCTGFRRRPDWRIARGWCQYWVEPRGRESFHALQN